MVDVAVAGSPAVELFGESPTRLVVTCDPVRPRGDPRARGRGHGVPVERLGTVGGDRLVISLVGRGATGAAEERGARVADEVDVPLVDIRHAWEHGLPRALGEEG